MLQRFGALLGRPVLSFKFSRRSTATPELLRKLKRAAERRAVVLCEPNALKGFMLKLVETLHEHCLG